MHDRTMNIMIPYGKQLLDDEDIKAVEKVLRSDWLTCGQTVIDFEKALADFCETSQAVAVSSGTAALHAAMAALDITEGDEVIVPPLTFAATANAVLYCGGTPVFADVDANTLVIDPDKVKAAITPKTKAVIGVDYAGQPCDWDALAKLAKSANIKLVADGCHALGGTYKGRRVGTLADMTVFSFHPVKHIATGEGGAIVTDNAQYAEHMRRFRNHGITTDARMRETAGTWYYEMQDLGFNYRITDIQCALGLSQMAKLPAFLERRRSIAHKYDTAFAATAVQPVGQRQDIEHAYHLYVVRVPNRDMVFSQLREAGIAAQVHYIPVHLHPYYRKTQRSGPGLFPVAEAAYGEIISLPMFPALTDDQQKRVIRTLLDIVE